MEITKTKKLLLRLVFLIVVNMLFGVSLLTEPVEASSVIDIFSVSDIRLVQNGEIKATNENNEDHHPSSWAVDGIEEARDNWLRSARLFSFYQSNITREEFSELIVNLYEAISESLVPEFDINPFMDTKEPYVLKVNSLGIAKGKGNNKFDPNGLITRQEMATMYFRLLDVLDIDPDITDEYVNFADELQISDYAKAPMQLMYKLDLIIGEGNNIMSPLKNSTREQAIAISNRIHEKFKKIKNDSKC